MADPADLERMDHALLRLRRMWDAPAGVPHEGVIVEGSTLLVCLAIAEHQEGAGQERARGHEVGVVEVADHLGVTQSTASRLVTRAVAAGMVGRTRSPADPRRAALTLTAAGRRLVTASREFRSAYLAALLADWNAADVATLASLLDRFATAVAVATPRPPTAPGGPPRG